MFTDRYEAGKLLAEELANYKGKDAVVLAIPRGGLPVGAVIAKSLGLPLDIALTKKIGHPFNKEYAIGAVSLNSIVLSEETGNVSPEYIAEETENIRNLLLSRRDAYYKNKAPSSIKDKTVILVDDGIATGNTILATIKLIAQENPKHILVAAPVSPLSAILKIEESPLVSEVLVLEQANNFHAIGPYYMDFNPITDQEAIKIFNSIK
ncbi:phosphoribosyltransferase [Echinicola shivajiensis]|uniref:phosphoribosyltransferase n=1 Tax=Echinicola shivajiensis TaxID=1035916 RepID=UPI001BFC4584|nr:phosphoribosyltransferase family protein [Echinicola shivajiensis]